MASDHRAANILLACQWSSTTKTISRNYLPSELRRNKTFKEPAPVSNKTIIIRQLAVKHEAPIPSSAAEREAPSKFIQSLFAMLVWLAVRASTQTLIKPSPGSHLQLVPWEGPNESLKTTNDSLSATITACRVTISLSVTEERTNT